MDPAWFLLHSAASRVVKVALEEGRVVVHHEVVITTRLEQLQAPSPVSPALEKNATADYRSSPAHLRRLPTPPPEPPAPKSRWARLVLWARRLTG